MPNGQNRYADKARQRSPRSGRTIRIGKNVGAAPIDGRYTDVVRELSGVLPLLTYGDWKRLGKWVIALAKEQGITPANDDNQATPSEQLTNSIGKWFEGLGLLPDGSKGWEPNEYNCKQLSPQDSEAQQTLPTTQRAHRLLAKTRRAIRTRRPHARGTSSGLPARNRRMGQPRKLRVLGQVLGPLRPLRTVQTRPVRRHNVASRTIGVLPKALRSRPPSV